MEINNIECPKCGSINNKSSKFCEICGKMLMDDLSPHKFSKHKKPTTFNEMQEKDKRKVEDMSWFEIINMKRPDFINFIIILCFILSLAGLDALVRGRFIRLFIAILYFISGIGLLKMKIWGRKFFIIVTAFQTTLISLLILFGIVVFIMFKSGVTLGLSMRQVTNALFSSTLLIFFGAFVLVWGICMIIYFRKDEIKILFK